MKSIPEVFVNENKISNLFGKEMKIINLGLESMAAALEQQNIHVQRIDWKPPKQTCPNLIYTDTGISIEDANTEVVNRIMGSNAVLIGMGIAKDVIPGMHDRMILHAGPPVEWQRMCGPTRGAVMGAMIYEGFAQDEKEAEKLAASGAFEFSPCHHHQTVGPMAGVVSPRMPVFIVKNSIWNVCAYATQNEGLGKVLRYGGMGDEVYQRLRWMEEVLYPNLSNALERISEGIDLKNLIAQALHMGDECHNRNRAGTSLFLRAIASSLIRKQKNPEDTAEIFEFINGNDHFFLNLSMPAAKAMLLPAEGVEGSTIVTVMARNGTDFGIRIASMPDEWFTAPAGAVDGLYLPGFSEQDANLDIGDSTITETAGFGGFAMAAAPAITQFVGGSPSLAQKITLDMYEITQTEHEDFTIPSLSFRGTPMGIDIRRVMETGILPQINTGIAHRKPGIGMVGAGMLQAPKKSFEGAYKKFVKIFCSSKE